MKRKLIPMTVRLNPDTHDRLKAITRRKPHLPLNVLINQILEEGLPAKGRRSDRARPA